MNIISKVKKDTNYTYRYSNNILTPTQHGTLPPWSPLPASASCKNRLLLSDNQATCFSHAGHAPHHFKLVSAHVFIRHGDRYPLYAIPKTKRPEIDCTLVANR